MTRLGSGVDVLAHRVGARSDLPIPLSLALYGGGMAVAISFAALALLWRTPKLTDGQPDGRVLPPGLQAVLDSPVLRRALQAVTLALALLVTTVALAGPPRTNDNIAPYAVYVTLWVGLIPVSLLLGPVWRVINPLRLLHRLLASITGPPPAPHLVDRLGYWPAALALLAFVWLELVYAERTDPRTVGIFLVLYAITQLIASLWFGERWFSRGDGFEVYSTLLGRLSPLGRRADGRLALRNPLRNAATLPEERGLAAVAVVLVGSTGFDGLSRTTFWTQGPGQANDNLSGTLGLLAMIGIAALLYVGATAANGRLAGQDTRRQPSLYAHSMIPIAVGYAVAHYFSLLLLDGQATWILASNPFALDGVDIFGTYDNAINYTLLSTSAIAYVQTAAIIVGHILGVVLAHDAALRVKDKARAGEQLPLVAAMIGFTVGGLALLFSV
jgi:hypothetical protein